MSDIDSYQTIAGPSYGEFKSKGSKFKAYAFSVKSKESFSRQLQLIKSNDKGANHYCWAYRIGAKTPIVNSNDDGEPRNTAGAPILRAIERQNLCNTACVVVRYFGGTKLGTRGLIEAYSQAATNALDTGEVITEFTWVNAVISAKYEHVGLLERVVKHDCIVVNERKQNTSLDYYILVRESYLKKLEKHVQENHLIDFYLI